jgi:hypothetical protein
MFSEDVPPVVPVDFEGRIVVFGTDYSRGAGMTRILKKSKPLKPLVIRDHHRDIAACLMHHPGVKMSDYAIFEELYGHCQGWEIDLLKVTAGTFALWKHGYISGSHCQYMANERTGELFDKPGPVI